MTKIGTYVLDTRSNRIGEVMDHLNGHLQLRPIGGGVEWDCHPTDAEPPHAGGAVERTAPHPQQEHAHAGQAQPLNTGNRKHQPAPPTGHLTARGGATPQFTGTSDLGLGPRPENPRTPPSPYVP